MTQMFGSGVYSTIPTNVASLAGTWNITTQNPSLSNAYVLVTPLQQPVITSTGTASSTNLANATNDIVTNMQGPAVQGFSSLVQPGNYIIYTPFPSGSIGNSALVPVAGIGLMTSANTISMVNFPYGSQSYWSLTAPLGSANTALSNAILSAATPLFAQASPGSPAGIAAQLGITPMSIQNANAAAISSVTSQTLPAQAAFGQMPLAALLLPLVAYQACP